MFHKTRRVTAPDGVALREQETDYALSRDQRYSWVQTLTEKINRRESMFVIIPARWAERAGAKLTEELILPAHKRQLATVASKL